MEKFEVYVNSKKMVEYTLYSKNSYVYDFHVNFFEKEGCKSRRSQGPKKGTLQARSCGPLKAFLKQHLKYPPFPDLVGVKNGSSKIPSTQQLLAFFLSPKTKSSYLMASWQKICKFPFSCKNDVKWEDNEKKEKNSRFHIVNF